MTRLCGNCIDEDVVESKQTFIYRDNQGNKYDACIKPICDKCIAAGEYIEERPGITRLYLGSERVFKEENDYGYGWYKEWRT